MKKSKYLSVFLLLVILCTNSIRVKSAILQENDDSFCHGDGVIESQHLGFTGGAYFNTQNVSGSSISWAIYGEAGVYTFNWRHGLGSSGRSAVLKVDAVDQAELLFPGTGAWNIWSSAISYVVALPAGKKIITLEANQSGGLPNIDFLEVTGASVTATSCGAGEGFKLVDNFNTRLNGSIRSQGDWTANPPGVLDGAIVTSTPPTDFSGKALMIDPSGVQYRGNAYIPINGSTIVEGATGTLFFQIYVEDLSDSYYHIGLSDLSNPRLTGISGDSKIDEDFEALFTLNQGVVSVGHERDILELSNLSLASQTLYNVWMVVDNTADTYEVYIEGGLHSSKVKAESNGQTVFNFGNGQASNDMQTLYSINSPNAALNSVVYIDNIYVDPSEMNLTNPAPISSSGYTVIENFDALTLGSISDQNGWGGSGLDGASVVFDSDIDDNKILQVRDDAKIFKNFLGIGNNTNGTVYFRIKRDGLVDASVGVSDISSPTEFNDFENQVSFKNDDTIYANNGDFLALSVFDQDVWNCVWIATNSTTDTYQIYMQGGELSQPENLASGNLSTFPYLNGEGSDDISTFFISLNNSSGIFYIDDINYSNSTNLITLPETSNSCTSIVMPEPLDDPIVETITKSGLSIKLINFASIPPSSSSEPVARINFLNHANDVTSRLFVNDLNHSLYLIDEGEVSVYLDLGNYFPDFISSPRLGTGFGFFTFHPEFSDNGKFYTVHTEDGESANSIPDYSSPEGVAVHGIITEWQATNPSANIFFGTKRELLRVGFETYLHGFQQIGFNPTAGESSNDYGLLYLALGDGEENPNFSNGPQNLSVPHGKILRIDPLGTDGPNNEYGIPPTNPFINQSDALGEIWAYGLRNPHRFSWDIGGTHKMFIGNIGEKNIDAIYLGLSGANYGWSNREGSFLFNKDDPNNVFPLLGNDSQLGYIYPVAEYDHDEGFAVVGGFVYRGSGIPGLQGKYVFGDIVRGRVFYTEESQMITGGPRATIHELTLFDENNVERTIKELAGGVSRADLRFGVDSQGELYFLSKQNGGIWRAVTLNSENLALRIEEGEVGFCGVEGSIDSNNSGFSGLGFANTDNTLGSNIDWSINVQQAGEYSFLWRYANGSSANRAAELIINGATAINTVLFPSTSQWANWSEAESSTSVFLGVGVNEINLRASTNSGLGNIDYIEVIGQSVESEYCSLL